MTSNDSQVAIAFTSAMVHQLREGLKKVEHCLAQLNDEQTWWRPTSSQNSIANLMLHLDGNVRQWIISGVGGEPDVRDRPREFAQSGPIAKGDLVAILTATIEAAIQAIDQQTGTSVLQARRIQGFDTTVAAAIVDSVSHFRGHCQEIVSLTRQQLQDRYQFSFVPESPEQGA
jgi:hypothetical protein